VFFENTVKLVMSAEHKTVSKTVISPYRDGCAAEQIEGKTVEVYDLA
jgi:hypothetical protein